MSGQKYQYAVVPRGLDGEFIATELGVQIYVTDEQAAQDRQRSVERAHGWRESLLVFRGPVA